MLTKVRLDGVMGKRFGKDWELAVSSPAEALRMIDANKPGLRAWMASNAEKYDAYKVICVHENGEEEVLTEQTFGMENRRLKSIRFTPLLKGASSALKIVVGVILVAVGVATGQAWMVKIGASLIIGGIIEALSPRPKTKDEDGNVNSYYFDGPVNTDQQGAAVPLIYGRVMAGSRPISASVSVDDIAPAG